MKLGEIKIEALKLMFASYERDFSVSDLNADAASDTYRDYLINMPGAINRAFAIIENKGVLPSKAASITCEEFPLPDDCLAVDRVVYRGRGEYIPNFPYALEGDTLIITDPMREGEKYILYYKPRITRVSSGTSNEDDLMEYGIPDYIAVYIPYFIKGELYREEQPGEASEAHNLFMKALDELIPEKAGGGSVTTVFSMRW